MANIDPKDLVEGIADPRLARAIRSTRDAAPRVDERTTRESSQIIGRDGEILSRQRNDGRGVDEFHIDERDVPKGWSWQWNAISVYNNPDIVAKDALKMTQNGWRPVKAENHPGKFMPVGYKGAIVKGGLRLEERPKAMSDEARAEDEMRARQQMRDRDQSLQGVKAKMAPGFEMSPKYRGTGGNIRMSIDPALDAERPNYRLADADE